MREASSDEDLAYLKSTCGTQADQPGLPCVNPGGDIREMDYIGEA